MKCGREEAWRRGAPKGGVDREERRRGLVGQRAEGGQGGGHEKKIISHLLAGLGLVHRPGQGGEL